MEFDNLAKRAKRTAREVTDFSAVADSHDLHENVQHVYVTYDHPESRHTLGVARLVPSSVRAVANRGDKETTLHTTSLLDEPLDCFDAAQHPFVSVVDVLFATGLATVPHPLNAPDFVKTMLLEACVSLAGASQSATKETRRELCVVACGVANADFSRWGFQTLDGAPSFVLKTRPIADQATTTRRTPRLRLEKRRFRVLAVPTEDTDPRVNAKDVVRVARFPNPKTAHRPVRDVHRGG